MARRKGKAQSRIKGWSDSEYGGSTAQDRDIKRQRMSPGKVKLREDRYAGQTGAETNDMPRIDGMVVGIFTGGACVRVEGRVLMCGIAKTFRAPEGSSALAVGDVTTVALTRPEHADGGADDKDRADGMILTRTQRRTVLARPQPWSAKRRDEYAADIPLKVLAANMDVLLIVASACQPITPAALIERFLIVADRGGLAPVLAINKIDLADPDEMMVESFRNLGVTIIPCSALTGAGVGDLRGTLAGKCSVLAGASGVGKSALVNAIVPGASAVTGAVRMKDDRGRHTTSAAAVYDLPKVPGLPEGGFVVDTPGLRELGMDFDEKELPWYFPEFAPHSARCKFRDCTHSHEPGCAVQKAVERGEIPPRRFESYLRILDDIRGQ